MPQPVTFGGRPGFGRFAFAQASTSTRRQIRPVASVSIGAGNSGLRTQLRTVRGVVSSISAISVMPARSGLMVAEPNVATGRKRCRDKVEFIRSECYRLTVIFLKQEAPNG
jgi:hypothetical protein